MEQSERPIKVLYIAGDQRSGSTIFQNVLGQVGGFCAMGELRELWAALIADRPRCGCGQQVADCDVWRAILAAAYGQPLQAAQYREFDRQSRRYRQQLLINRFLPVYDLRWDSNWLSFRDQLLHLFRGIQKVAGCEIIIDSSKSPAYGYMLGLLPNVDVYALHLVRDPRGAQYSLLKRQQQQHRKLRTYNLFAGSAKWLSTNALTGLIFQHQGAHYLRLRYEDFCEDPVAAIQRVLDWLGEKREVPASLQSHEVNLPVIHTVGGSPHRFSTGKTVLRKDTEWKGKLTPMHQLQIALGAGLGLLYYGYWPGNE